MSVSARRLLLLVLTVLALYVGGWAYFATGSWYRSFPGFGLNWLPVLGPYNEHLAKDVGALYLALAVLSASAARWAGDARLVRVTGLTWLVFSVPHLVFHLRHLDMYGTRDQVLNVVALGLFVVVGAVLMCVTGPGGVRGGQDPGRVLGLCKTAFGMRPRDLRMTGTRAIITRPHGR